MGKANEVLTAPVPLDPSIYQCDDASGRWKQGHADCRTKRPIPAREQRNRQLRRADHRHHRRVSSVSVAAPWAVSSVLRVDIARRVGPCPERAAAACENPRAEIDEEGAGDSEGNQKGADPAQQTKHG